MGRKCRDDVVPYRSFHTPDKLWDVKVGELPKWNPCLRSPEEYAAYVLRYPSTLTGTPRYPYLRKIANNTWLYHTCSRNPKESERVIKYGVQLHNTCIVEWVFHPGTETWTVHVDTGGWATPLTKERMNRFLPYGWHAGTQVSSALGPGNLVLDAHGYPTYAPKNGVQVRPRRYCYYGGKYYCEDQVPTHRFRAGRRGEIILESRQRVAYVGGTLVPDPRDLNIRSRDLGRAEELAELLSGPVPELIKQGYTLEEAVYAAKTADLRHRVLFLNEVRMAAQYAARGELNVEIRKLKSGIRAHLRTEFNKYKEAFEFDQSRTQARRRYAGMAKEELW